MAEGTRIIIETTGIRYVNPDGSPTQTRWECGCYDPDRPKRLAAGWTYNDHFGVAHGERATWENAHPEAVAEVRKFNPYLPPMGGAPWCESDDDADRDGLGERSVYACDECVEQMSDEDRAAAGVTDDEYAAACDRRRAGVASARATEAR